MTEQVVYELGLRDKMSAGIDGATSHVKTLESTLGGVKSLLGGIGVGLAAFKGYEFLQQSNEMWEKMEFSMSQVEAALKSTQGAAGLTFDELKKGAEDTAHSLKFTQAEIMGMQSILLTFPSVTKETFGQASTIIEDMSTRLGQDLKSSTIQLGKALQDPERGITALRRVGVNFNDEQTKMIKNLAATNHMAEAQAMILKELTLEFGGSAAAAAEADKSFRLDKTMEENKVALGEMIDKIKEELMPILISVANGFKNMIGWIKENGTMLKNLALALGTAWTAFKVIGGATAIMEAIGASSAVAVTGIEAVGTAATLSMGPIGLLSVAIGGLIFVYNQWLDMNKQQMEKAVADTNSVLNASYVADVNQEVQGLVLDMKKYSKNIKGINETAFNIEKEKLMAELQAARDSKDAAKQEKAEGKLTALNAMMNKETGLIPAKTTAKPGDKPVVPGGTDAKTKATGSKSVTINVSIKDLIGTQNINTTNLRESAGKIKDVVVAALTGAVNDFQIVAGQP